MSEVTVKPLTGGNQFRSQQKARMIRMETQRDGSQRLHDAYLPIGRGWNAGNGVLDYINLGWMPYDQWAAEQHKKEVEAKREEKGKK